MDMLHRDPGRVGVEEDEEQRLEDPGDVATLHGVGQPGQAQRAARVRRRVQGVQT
jgi:hypothetical protein